MLARLAVAMLLVLVLGASAHAADPPLADLVARWAKGTDFKITAQIPCDGIEELLGATSTSCWKLKRNTPTTAGGNVYPRMVVTVGVYTSEDAAKRRLAHFTGTPPGLTGEREMVYPLRAGFRVGAEVVVVTTDALRFEADVFRAAIGLTAALRGTELTCWGAPTCGVAPSGLAAPIAAWAAKSDYDLSASPKCAGTEEHFFGAARSTCWSARRRTALPSKSKEHDFPRLDVTIATYASDGAARARMTKFSVRPAGLTDAEITYPLRAGFRVGAEVVVVTTDANIFAPDVFRAAVELVALTGASDLTCYGKKACPAR